MKLMPVGKHDELPRRFEKARALKQFDVNDVAAGRAYMEAYISFYKYAEGEEHAHYYHRAVIMRSSSSFSKRS